MEEDKPKFVCKRCGFNTEYKRTILTHLTHDIVCTVKEGMEDIDRVALIEGIDPPRDETECHRCDWCDKFISKSNFSKHRKICRKKPDEASLASSSRVQHNNHVDVLIVLLQQKDDELTMMRKEVERLQEENKRLKEDKPPQARPKHAKGNISSTVRILCWNTHIGEEIAKTKCMCCKNLYITQHNFECGHVVARCDGGTLEINNLRPICHKCNNSMGSMNMIEFMTQHGWTL
jgi:5-methylcytosine-specific restriction endonuclease McrA